MSESAHQGSVAGTHWDPNQYLKFTDHRLRPALELLQRVPLTSPKVVYDLGCGLGNVTRMIADQWPAADVYGLDHSQQMLEQAAVKSSRVHWLQADVRHWAPSESPDLMFSNATLQWIDGHDDLFPRLMSFLNSGGCLAVQMPLSWSMPSHRLMREVLADGGVEGAPIGSEQLRVAVGRKWVEDAEIYYDLLVSRATNLDLWETEYLQVLSGQDPVLEWVKSTGLRPILNGLDDEDREVFLVTYRQRLGQIYPKRSNGFTLYPFRRLFVVAIKA
ncbi:MAG: methyltransferase domain-containing protein [bacterium]|nr:methyltransferase domain-containing protein [bacterium]